MVKALEVLGFKVVRKKEHISMLRENQDGTRTPLTMPNHPKIKASTLRPSALRRVSRETSS
jgi:predicted RNA binding protein YcfA (HicA-like mRNA interferase family)